MFNFIRKSIIENRENDDMLYEYVLSEIEDKIIIKSLWAKAIAKAEGNDKKIEPLYMQYRVQNIKDQFSKLNIAYSDMRKEVLFNKIKSIFFSTESQYPTEGKIIETRQEKIPKIDTSENDAMDLLVKKGYKVNKTYSGKWKIKEPLGGKTTIDTLQELIVYAQSRSYH